MSLSCTSPLMDRRWVAVESKWTFRGRKGQFCELTRADRKVLAAEIQESEELAEAISRTICLKNIVGTEGPSIDWEHYAIPLAGQQAESDPPRLFSTPQRIAINRSNLLGYSPALDYRKFPLDRFSNLAHLLVLTQADLTSKPGGAGRVLRPQVLI